MDKIDLDTLPDWDAADYLTTPSSQAEYLSIVMEDGDETEIARALAAITRARTKAGLDAPVAGGAIPGPTLYAEGANTISQALSIVKALGLKLNVQPADAA